MTEKLQLPPEQAAPRAAEKAGLWQKLKRGLFMTHTEILDRVGAAVEGRAVLDEGTIEHLEEALLGADLGVETTLELVGRIRQRARREAAGLDQLRDLLREEMTGLLVEASTAAPPIAKPGVILVVGVNGVGKTTSIAKLAGRLHTKDNLMAELAKMARVIDREAPERKRFTLLVLDATNGQNAVTQAREFARIAAVDGVLLSKLDGTAKGGVAVAIARELKLPVMFLGVGESPDDLVDFE